jgi:phage terminase large subunit-like protein
VTKRSLYENKGNLSPKFIREIERKYAGTRLGRQEIDGDVIDDIDGALWKRKWIDDFRARTHPELKRIVVAVDPPASSFETSDTPAECGIVVSGLGVDGHGYVLADFSLVGTPDEWASEALRAYAYFEADCIVGEVNNGGEMVGHTIKTAAKDKKMKLVPYKAVRASRGKQLRAEPISLPYQRGLVHHVGCHSDLEDQQCNWVPGEKSPDRLDALVWGLTELMIEEAEGGGLVMASSNEEESGDTVTVGDSRWSEMTEVEW